MHVIPALLRTLPNLNDCLFGGSFAGTVCAWNYGIVQLLPLLQSENGDDSKDNEKANSSRCHHREHNSFSILDADPVPSYKLQSWRWHSRTELNDDTDVKSATLNRAGTICTEINHGRKISEPNSAMILTWNPPLQSGTELVPFVVKSTAAMTFENRTPFYSSDLRCGVQFYSSHKKWIDELCPRSLQEN